MGLHLRFGLIMYLFVCLFVQFLIFDDVGSLDDLRRFLCKRCDFEKWVMGCLSEIFSGTI